MKPRLFIASSREGLDIANALHANLDRAAEVTIWNQAFFDLSATALQSLVSKLPNFDFGAFVFLPEDLVSIRGTTQSAVRDNVIFELGLFTGHLGQDRCFILAPYEDEDLRFPTDILGLEPARYDSRRSDGNLIAATSPAANRVSAHMAAKGPRLEPSAQSEGTAPPVPTTGDPAEGKAPGDPTEINSSLTVPQETTTLSKHSAEAEPWIRAAVNRNYEEAAELLEPLIKQAQGDEKHDRSLWRARMLFAGSIEKGETVYLQLAKDSARASVWAELVYGLLRDGFSEKALRIADEALSQHADHPEVVAAKADSLRALRRFDDASALLTQFIAIKPGESRVVFLALAQLQVELQQPSEALNTLRVGLQIFPLAVDLLELQASVLFEQRRFNESHEIYRQLERLRPQEAGYPALAGNALLELEFFGLAMDAYKRADQLANNTEAWIVANIGNLMNRRGFYGVAAEYLERALALDPKSDYARDRLVQAKQNHGLELQRFRAVMAATPPSEPIRSISESGV